MEHGQNNKDELYKKAPLHIRELYAGEDTGELLWQTATKVGINGGKVYREFAMTIGDVILGSQDKSSLPRTLKDRVNLSEVQIKVVIESIKSLLDKLPGVISPENLPAYVIENTLLGADQHTETTGATSAPDMLKVKPLRTFAEDVEISRAHGYGAFRSPSNTRDSQEPIHRSSQDDIIGQ